MLRLDGDDTVIAQGYTKGEGRQRFHRLSTQFMAPQVTDPQPATSVTAIATFGVSTV